MTTVDLHSLTDEQLTDHLVAWFKGRVPRSGGIEGVVVSLSDGARAGR
jgi:hypothetical protein